jgi:hypothetical protein
VERGLDEVDVVGGVEVRVVVLAVKGDDKHFPVSYFFAPLSRTGWGGSRRMICIDTVPYIISLRLKPFP